MYKTTILKIETDRFFLAVNNGAKKQTELFKRQNMGSVVGWFEVRLRRQPKPNAEATGVAAKLKSVGL